jgi:threonine dehydrogenase-like Zn-dependent dehydrogenase
MDALWVEDQNLSFLRDIPCPKPADNEALIRVKMAGICATDLEQLSGYHPFLGIPGHEFVGVVESAPSNPKLIGQRVVGEINIGCGECRYCVSGRVNHCLNRKVIGIRDHHGCFCDYMVLPVKNLIPVPDSIPDDIAVFTEPVAAAVEILQQIQIKPTDKVMIVGGGRLGQLIARVIGLIPCDLHIVVRHKLQRELLAMLEVNILEDNEIPDERMDLVIDATGSPDGFNLGTKVIRPQGTIVLKSTYSNAEKINLSSIVVDEITLVGSRCGPFIPAIKLLSEKKVDPTPLISMIFPLIDGIQAYNKAAEPGIMKILLQM